MNNEISNERRHKAARADSIKVGITHMRRCLVSYSGWRNFRYWRAEIGFEQAYVKIKRETQQ